MLNGFVFGKFYPLHNGHVSMIRYALELCENLYVLVCASDKESISSDVRASWIEDEFTNNLNVHVLRFDYKEDQLPNSSESSLEVSVQWANAFQELLPPMDFVVTSEPYGDYVATCMKIQHRCYDLNRSHCNISASTIRKAPYKYWKFLPNSAKRYFQKSVSIVGTESTGKTTLADYLATTFNGYLVKEIGRELVPNSNSFGYKQLLDVVARHAESIRKAKAMLTPLVVIDTDFYTTLSYSEFAFARDLNVDIKDIEESDSDLRLYLSNDVQFVQDGTRMDMELRDKLDASLKAVLTKWNVGFQLISGDWGQREAEAKRIVSNLLIRAGRI